MEKEALAIIYMVRKFRKFVYGRPFTLVTDDKTLFPIFGLKMVVPIYPVNRLQRWAITLLDNDLETKYCKTIDFGRADGLSRLMKLPSSKVL